MAVGRVNKNTIFFKYEEKITSANFLSPNSNGQR